MPQDSTEPQENPILAAMLDRLYASLMRGPGLNCRPTRSRQRIDLTHLDAFDDLDAPAVLQQLLDNQTSAVRVTANVPPPRDDADSRWKKQKPPAVDFKNDKKEDPPEPADVRAYRQQRKLLAKLRNLSDDAKTYQQDTGVHALNLGYPILSIPPGQMGGARILAPIAFVPLSLTIKTTGRPGIALACYAADTDRVTPNPALLAWLERHTGTRAPDDLFDDDAGEEPWREIAELIRFTAGALELPDIDPHTFLPPSFSEQNKPKTEEQSDETPDETPDANPPFTLSTCPSADGLPDRPAILNTAVLGLFPAGNQGLLRDTREMLNQPHPLTGPVQPFIQRAATLTPRPQHPPDPSTDQGRDQTPAPAPQTEDHTHPRPVALADPCQLRATTLARTHRALVLHGPPGTGKSQTITNIIGDHLARGQRVLFVCDKRTALDVVAHRLDALGLASLCAVVHDPKRDQRHLYMSIRAQLERLTDIETHPRAHKRLEQIDRELDDIHAELAALHHALMQRIDDRPGIAADSFHQLVGRWLAITAPALPADQLTAITLEDLDEHRRTLEVLLERGNDIHFPANPWSAAAQGPLENYLTQPVDELRRKLASAVEDARAADATHPATGPAIPPFAPDEPLQVQANRRAALLDHLRWLNDHPDEVRANHAADLDPDALPQLTDKLRDAQPWRDALAAAPLDPELQLATRADTPTPRALTEHLGNLDQYLDTTTHWYAFLCLPSKSRAAKTLRHFGLKRTPDHARRLRDFLDAVRARILLSAAAENLTNATPTADPWPDEKLAATFAQLDHLLPALQLAQSDAILAPRLREVLRNPDPRAALIAALEKSPARSTALQTLENALENTTLLNPRWQQHAAAAFRAHTPPPPTPAQAQHDPTPDRAEKTNATSSATSGGSGGGGKPAHPTLARLLEKFDDLETILRIHDGLASLPTQLRAATTALLQDAAAPDAGLDALAKRIIEHTLTARVAAHPTLAKLDPQALEHAFTRHAQLEKERREKTTDAILHRWTQRQRDRLLVGTGTKLNALGAAVRQRLFVRGKRAMRLRQVIEVGQNTNYPDADQHETSTSTSGVTSGGGDPIFDLAPVWLASPETIAQCFPRTPFFDVVIFDEASQCRLEEALPVLTRAHRVVIAGDPQQLPPTRFFEAAIATSDNVEIKDEDDLFEAQQTEVEDLLAAALNLDVQESYLDVHYRSRNADLIEFSNENFYRGRLQAIPGHPQNFARFAPLSLHRADTTYQDRVNPGEAALIVNLVDDLLKRADPPSIGIACFNLAQRDVVAEALDDHALENPGFAKRLDRARNRDGESSFEGLFVKNLENVQGDERDHIIISTTYGPNADGKFYRRFGPLAMPGGGRRLNVLVTRARHEVHLVTSIPPGAYRAAAPVPEGASPSGSWLLFAYLRYAEMLEEAYAQQQTHEEEQGADAPAAQVRPTQHPSHFATALAETLADERGLASEVFWGNEGFCVDLALQQGNPASEGKAKILGTLTDFSRYAGPSDAVSWDLYRVGILRWQGWDLHRLWTPTFFRDPQRSMNQLQQRTQRREV